MNTKILFLSLISGLSTVIGCVVLLISKKYKNKVLTFSFGLSGTIMILISILELVPEAISYSINVISIPILFIVSLIIMTSGGVIVRLLDKLSNNDDEIYNVGWLCMLSLLIHNIPEGIITSLSLLSNYSFGIKMLLIIMIHNIPEGISIAAPIYYSGNGVRKSLIYSTVSGGGEFVGAILGLYIFKYFNIDILMYLLLMLTAGIMIYLSVVKLFKNGIKLNEYKWFIIGIVIGIVVVFTTL